MNEQIYISNNGSKQNGSSRFQGGSFKPQVVESQLINPSKIFGRENNNNLPFDSIINRNATVVSQNVSETGLSRL